MDVLEIVESYPEGFAAAEVVEEGTVSLFGFGGVVLCEVDEIGAVREDVSVLGLVIGTAFVQWPLTWRRRSSSRDITCGIGLDGRPGELGSPISFVI